MSGRRASSGAFERLVVRLYRVLVRLYPLDFRTRFGERMVEDFRRLVSEECRAGTRGQVRVWRRVVRDVSTSLPGEWWRRLFGRVRQHGRRGNGMMREDARMAFKSLTRAPVFTLTVVAILAIGIGINTAAFSVVSAYVVRPLPFPDSERIVEIGPVDEVSWTELDEIFRPAVSWDLDAFTILGGDRPDQVRGAWVTPGFFELHGIEPALGRGFLPSESGAGAASVAVLSHGLWQRRYGGDADVIGRTFSAFSSDRPDDAEVFTIVGVLPEDFWFYSPYTELLVPLRGERSPYVARLRDGVTMDAAGDYLTRLEASRMDDVPERFRVELTPLRESYAAEVRPVLTTLIVAVLLVLLIACVNTGVLLLVRASGREAEFGVRAALGAGRRRIARQLLAEGALIAAAAGALGVALAASALTTFGVVIEQRLGTPVPGGAGMLHLDGFSLTVALGAAVVTGLFFGLVPTVSLGGSRVFRALREAGGQSSPSSRRRSIRNAMVVSVVALSLALLVAAGLMVRSAIYLQRQELGFEPERLSVVDVNLRRRSYPELGQRAEFFRRLVEGTRTLPGVEDAGVVLRAPFLWRLAGSPVEAEGRPVADPESGPTALNLNVGDGYFRAMGISLTRGRGFGDQDVAGAPLVTVVSGSLAQRLWPGQDPLGKRLRYLPRSQREPATRVDEVPWVTVVGVVSDVVHSFPEEGPETYTPIRQGTPALAHLVVRSRAAGERWEESLVALVRGLDPEVPVSAPMSMEAAVSDAMGNTRFLAGLLGAFAGFAFVLAVLGLYGVVSYTVAQARRDVAIRIALGAGASRVLGEVMREGLSLVSVGVVLGLAGAMGLSGVLASQLHGVSTMDTATFSMVTAALSSAAILAIFVPARRAAGADPMEVLRQE